MSFLNKDRILEIVRFGIVGVIATLIQYFIYIIFLNIIGANVAFTLGYIISFCFNFILSNYFTFKTNPTKEKGIKFLFAHGFNYFLQLGLLNLFIWVGITEKLAPFLVYSISIPVNYLLVGKALKKNDNKKS